jgi:hypothetical protein
MGRRSRPTASKCQPGCRACRAESPEPSISPGSDGGFWWISSDGSENAALTLGFISVPEGKTVKNRVHLDLNPSGCEQAEETARHLREILAAN